MLAALAVAPTPGRAAEAACGPPTLTIVGAPEGRAALRRGQEVTVTGRGFVEGCGRAGGGPVPACTREEPLGEPVPMTGVELEIVGGLVSRRATSLGVADADPDTDDRLGRIVWTVEIPEGQATGPAALRVDGPRDLSVGVGVEVVAE